MAEPKNAPEGAANISKFKISSNTNNRAVDFGGGVVDFRYYESVLSNNITATATIVETGFEVDGEKVEGTKSILDSLPIRGGERTDIVIEDNKNNKIRFDVNGLYVNRVRNASPGTSKDVYFLDFAPKEYFANEQIRVMARYEGKISEHVGQILQSIGARIEKIDVTSSTYNFVGNDRKPFYTCTWLATKAIPDKDIGTRAAYLFYQTRNGYNFRSIDSLFEQEPVKKLIYNNTGILPEGYDINILSYTIDQDVELKQNMTLGTYNNRSVYFDFLSMNYFVKEYKYVPDELGISGKTFGADMVAKEFTQSPTRLMTHVFDIGVNPNGTGDAQLDSWRDDPERANFDAENAMVQPVMRYNQMFSIKVNITIGLDISIKAGDIVMCDFPAVMGEKNKETNKQTGGIYMVASVCHNLTSRESFTSLSLVRDSFGKKQGF